MRSAFGRNGMVAAGHPLATSAALAVLRDGGNAVDAAVCAGLVLSVVCPHASSLAGDLYMLIRTPDGSIDGLNGTGAAPTAATLTRFADGIPRDGILSASVPGLLAGFASALERHGTRDLASLLAPAIAYAAEGFPVYPYLARNIRDRATLLAKNPTAAAMFLPDGEPLVPGQTLHQPALAALLRAIAAGGAEAFYQGAPAAAIAADCAALGGLITAADLAAHETLWQTPLAVNVYGHDIWTMPPNSYGPTLLLQLLDLAASGIDSIAPDNADFILRGHAARVAAYKATAGLIGDPDRLEAPVRQLVAAAAAGARPAPAAMPAEARDRCTTNAVVIDREGGSVSLIQSISAPFGAGVMLPSTGILLNNRMAGFTTDPASANCVAPGRRPANTLAPCLVTQDDRLVMTIGTPGTVGQTCTLAQILVRLLAHGENPATAVAAPRWSVDFQGKLVLEASMAPELRDAVIAQHPAARTMPTGWISFGSIKLAMASNEGWLGIADGRRAAATDGY